MTYAEIDPPVTREEIAVLEARLSRQSHRSGTRALVLFLLMVLAFALLAYRTEVNANALARGFYDACVTRQEREVQANVGRETMVQLAANAPNAPTEPVAKTLIIQQLRDALLLPIEDCGTPP